MCYSGFTLVIGGERGIRTPGGVTLNGFQDRRNRPLCHLSLMCIESIARDAFAGAKLIRIFFPSKFFAVFYAKSFL